MTNLDSILKSREITNKGPSSQSYGFSRSHVWIWELDCKESWVPKNWCFWTVVLEKTLGTLLDCKEIKSVNPNGNESWIFIGRTEAEAAAPILWPSDVKNWLTGKDPDARKRLKAGGKHDGREWDGWMASPTGRTWVWAISGSWWWTGKPGVLQSMGSQSIGHDWVTELNLTGCNTRPSQEMGWGLTLLRNSARETVSPERILCLFSYKNNIQGFPSGLVVKNPPFIVDIGLIRALGRFHMLRSY